MKRGWQAVLVFACLSCAGELEDPGRFAFLFDDDDAGATPPNDAGTSMPAPPPPACLTTLFKNSCGLAGCHSAGAAQIDLVSPNVQSRLVDKKSTSADCSNRTYVTTDGTSSLLVQKLMDSPPCGVKMPIGPALSSTEQKCVTDWVSSLSN